MPFSTWKTHENPLKAPWFLKWWFFKHFSGIFHGATSMKSARKIPEKCLKNPWFTNQGAFRGFSKSWGFPKGFFVRGEISIIGVVRAPVAITNFAFFVRGLLIKSYINSETFTDIWRKINYCNRCARDTNYWDLPPPPLLLGLQVMHYADLQGLNALVRGKVCRMLLGWGGGLRTVTVIRQPKDQQNSDCLFQL